MIRHILREVQTRELTELRSSREVGVLGIDKSEQTVGQGNTDGDRLVVHSDLQASGAAPGLLTTVPGTSAASNSTKTLTTAPISGAS